MAHIAVEKRNSQMLDILVEHKIDLNIQNKQGQTPLLLALEQDLPEFSKKLLEYGASPDHKDTQGQTTLHLLLKIKMDQKHEVLENCLKNKMKCINDHTVNDLRYIYFI